METTAPFLLHAAALSGPDSTKVSVTSLLCVPPSAEQTLRPADEESAEVWANLKSNDSWYFPTPNGSRTARLGRTAAMVIFEKLPCPKDKITTTIFFAQRK